MPATWTVLSLAIVALSGAALLSILVPAIIKALKTDDLVSCEECQQPRRQKAVTCHHCAQDLIL